MNYLSKIAILSVLYINEAWISRWRLAIYELLNQKLGCIPSWFNQIWLSDEAHFNLNGSNLNHSKIF